MKRRIDYKEMLLWRESAGGIKEAARLISEKLECSLSKAEKIAGCRYPSVPTPTEQMALASLMQRPRDVVFPFACKRVDRAS